MARSSNDLLQGHGRSAHPQSRVPRAMHGWGISQRIQQVTRGVLEVNQGALYPALHRLEDHGLARRRMGDVREQSTREVLSRSPPPADRQLTVEDRTWQRYAQRRPTPPQRRLSPC